MRAAPDKRSGAALFVVIVFTLVLANIASLALFSASSGLKSSAVYADRARAAALGQALVPLTRYYISQDQNGRKRGGAFVASFPTGDVKVGYRSESARVDVNLSSVDLIRALLVAVGEPRRRAQEIADRLKQRRSAHPPLIYKSQFEISDDWGLTNREADRILPYLTVANADGTVDPLLASQEVLAALFDSSSARIKDFLKRRRVGFPNQETVLSYFPENEKNWLTFSDVSTVRAMATVTTRRGLVQRFEASFALRAKDQDPKIYYWRAME